MTNIIGENIRKVRMGKGISRIKLADMTEGKVSKNAIYCIENGITSPRDSTIKIIAKALDVPVDELMGGIKEVSMKELIARIIYRLDDIDMKLNKLIDKEVKENE